MKKKVLGFNWKKNQGETNERFMDASINCLLIFEIDFSLSNGNLIT